MNNGSKIRYEEYTENYYIYDKGKLVVLNIDALAKYLDWLILLDLSKDPALERTVFYSKEDGLFSLCEGKKVKVYNLYGVLQNFVQFIALPGTLEIPCSLCESFLFENILLNEGLVIIGERAFECSKIKEIKLPRSLKRIGTFAFADASLQSLVLPPILEKLGVGNILGPSYNTLKSLKAPRSLEDNIESQVTLSETPVKIVYYN